MMWEPIKTAPKDGTKILAFRAIEPFNNVHHYWVARWTLCGGKKTWVMEGKNTKISPSHWMPLPEPPK